MLRRFVSCLVLSLFAASSWAAVTRVEIAERKDIGYPGYEQVSGKVYFAVDPKLERNKNIVDLSLAPKNAKGLVEFSADLHVIRPKDGKGNGTALFQVSNRGTRDLLNVFDLAAGGALATPQDFGDPLLFRMGFTMVWVGWEWDVQGDNQLKLYAPKLPGVTGSIMAQIITNAPSTSQPLGDRNLAAYPVADQASATMYVRDSMDGARSTVPREQWKFNAAGTAVEMATGFTPGRIYEVVYQAGDATVAGLGPAAIRDYISYMKKQNEVRRAIAFGVSQSGRFLRTYLYDGFNTDEAGKQVFEGVWAHVAGAGRGDFNYRLAQPSRSDGNYPLLTFPFTDDNETDGSRTDGLLARARKDNTVPKVFYTNSDVEYWGRAAALTHITLDGKRDLAPSQNTRIYYIAGAPHGANGAATRSTAQNINNPLDYRLLLRALLPAMTDWVIEGKEPPASKIPRIDKDELAPLSALAFPKIPGIRVPQEPTTPFRFDFGPDFVGKGIAGTLPPKAGPSYALLLPQTDSDGNEIGGVRLPDQKVALATYTGWNLRDSKIGGSDMRLPLTGSLIPFARTKAEREESKDPRPSVEERYTSEQDYLRRVEAAARALVSERYMLEQDIALAVEKGKTRWDFVQKGAK